MTFLKISPLHAAILLTGACVPMIHAAPGSVRQFQADPERLETHVRSLTRLPSGNRWYMNPQAMEEAGKYIETEFKKAGMTPERQVFEAAGKQYFNVRALWGDPKKPRIVIGAHYDACGDMPGADDNASGVAGILEAARLLKAVIPDPSPAVEWVAYALEEPPFFNTPLMGSYHHAAMLKRDGVPVRLMISVEMIGFFSDAEGSQKYPSVLLNPFYPSRANFIAAVSDLRSRSFLKPFQKAFHEFSSVPCEILAAPGFLLGIDLSDHQSYWKHGFRAIMLTDTAFFRSPHYHTPSDLPETLDYHRMAEVVNGLCGYVRQSQD